MDRLVLTDASPLIGLSIVGGLPWLKDLFGEIWMPIEVEREVLSGRVSRGEDEIRGAVADKWLRIFERIPQGLDFSDLDEGEAACIRAALSIPGEALILMDERAGRAIAMEQGLLVAGTAAIIGMAKTRGLIPSAREIFEKLHDSDFRIATEVILTVLKRVGE